MIKPFIGFISAVGWFIVLLASAGAVEHLTSSAETQAKLEALIASDDRSDRHKARDQYRHPFETLTFFGVEPEMTVVEIWPGGQGGWYRRILEPFLEQAGTYIPLIESTNFPDDANDLPYGRVDLVLVFRAHGFMIYRDPAQEHVEALFKMLKPDGIFGIVDHAGDENIPQDPKGVNGYVNESHFFMLAKKTGFCLLAINEVNRNPKDTKHHPNGVYSLLPSLWGSRSSEEEEAAWRAIGESDRFTHKYYKPASGTCGP